MEKARNSQQLWVDHHHHRLHPRKTSSGSHLTHDKLQNPSKVTRPAPSLWPQPPAHTLLELHPSVLDRRCSTLHTVCSWLGHSCPFPSSPQPGLWTNVTPHRSPLWPQCCKGPSGQSVLSPLSLRTLNDRVVKKHIVRFIYLHLCSLSASSPRDGH